MIAVLHSIVLVSFSLRFNQPAEAVSSVNSNRGIVMYYIAYDICKEITPYSGHESKAAADEACEKAFVALDETRLNSCQGWRQAACRFIPGEEYYRCTCRISMCIYSSVKSDIAKTFRDCAHRLLARVQVSTQIAEPSTNFQRFQSDDNAAWPTQQGLDYSGYYNGAGSSNGIYTSGVAGSSSDAHISVRTGSSSGHGNIYTSHTPGSSVGSVGRRVEKYRKLHDCDECGRKFRSARILFDHKRIHHTVADSHCYLCNLTYKTNETFLGHLRSTHPKIAKEEKESRRVPADPAEAEALLPYSCPSCPKRYGSEHGLKDHLKSHTTRVTICRECKKIFSTKAILKAHMELFHPGVPMIDPAAPNGGPSTRVYGSGHFKCGDCGRSYNRKNALLDHERSHKSKDTYCDSCDVTLSTKYSYRSHLKRKHPEIAVAESEAAKKRHKEENPEKCEQCGKRFKNIQGLRKHKTVHDGKTKCSECGAVFGKKSTLDTHMTKTHRNLVNGQ